MSDLILNFGDPIEDLKAFLLSFGHSAKSLEYLGSSLLAPPVDPLQDALLNYGNPVKEPSKDLVAPLSNLEDAFGVSFTRSPNGGVSLLAVFKETPKVSLNQTCFQYINYILLYVFTLLLLTVGEERGFSLLRDTTFRVDPKKLRLRIAPNNSRCYSDLILS